MKNIKSRGGENTRDDGDITSVDLSSVTFVVKCNSLANIGKADNNETGTEVTRVEQDDEKVLISEPTRAGTSQKTTIMKDTFNFKLIDNKLYYAVKPQYAAQYNATQHFTEGSMPFGGGGRQTVVRNGRKYKVRTGTRGGQFIVVSGTKHYV